MGDSGNTKPALDWRFIATFAGTMVPTLLFVAYLSGQQTSKIEQTQRSLDEVSVRFGTQLSGLHADLGGQVKQAQVVSEKQLDQVSKRVDAEERRQESTMQITIQNQTNIEGLVRTVQQLQLGRR